MGEVIGTLTHCPKAWEDESWKHEPGYFGYARRYIYGTIGVKSSVIGDSAILEGEGVLCLAIIMPGEKSICFLPLGPAPEQINGGTNWTWDGNLTHPTLEPSVDSSRYGGWHEYIRQGRFENP